MQAACKHKRSCSPENCCYVASGGCTCQSSISLLFCSANVSAQRYKKSFIKLLHVGCYSILDCFSFCYLRLLPYANDISMSCMKDKTQTISQPSASQQSIDAPRQCCLFPMQTLRKSDSQNTAAVRHTSEALTCRDKTNICLQKRGAPVRCESAPLTKAS